MVRFRPRANALNNQRVDMYLDEAGLDRGTSRLKWLSLVVMLGTGFLAGGGHAADAPTLKSEVGPVTNRYGGTDWLVYSCEDKGSLVIVTAPGNPAVPFYFFYLHSGKGYELHGEGTGDKRSTDAALNDLKNLSEDQITSLVVETQKATIHK